MNRSPGSGEIYGFTFRVKATGTYAPVGENAYELTTTELKQDGVVKDDLPGPFVVRATGENELRVRVFVQSNQHATYDLLEGEEPQNRYNDKYVWRTMKCQTLEFPGFEYPGTMVKLGPDATCVVYNISHICLLAPLGHSFFPPASKTVAWVSVVHMKSGFSTVMTRSSFSHRPRTVRFSENMRVCVIPS